MKPRKQRKTGLAKRLFSTEEYSLLASYRKKLYSGDKSSITDGERGAQSLLSNIKLKIKKGLSEKEAYSQANKRKPVIGNVKQLVVSGLMPEGMYESYLGYTRKLREGNKDLATDEERRCTSIVALIRNYVKEGLSYKDAYSKATAPKVPSVIDKIREVMGDDFAENISSYKRKRDLSMDSSINVYEMSAYLIYSGVRRRLKKGIDIHKAIIESTEAHNAESFADTFFTDKQERFDFGKAATKVSKTGTSSLSIYEYRLYRKHQNAYKKHRLLMDKEYYEETRIRSLLGLARNGYSKDTLTYDMLGTDHSTYMENLYSTNPDLDLRDAEIDHIVPFSLAKTCGERLIVNHYLNFQLLTPEQNGASGKWDSMPEFHSEASVRSHKNSYVLMVIAFFNYSRYAQYHDADINISVDRKNVQIEIYKQSEMAA